MRLLLPSPFVRGAQLRTSVTKNFWRSVWLLVSGDTGSRERFIVWTDHQNLEYIRFAKRLNARQARWALFFGRFDFTISFRPGSKNPDALSRQFGSSEVSPTTENILPQRCVVGETSDEPNWRERASGFLEPGLNEIVKSKRPKKRAQRA